MPPTSSALTPARAAHLVLVPAALAVVLLATLLTGLTGLTGSARAATPAPAALVDGGPAAPAPEVQAPAVQAAAAVDIRLRRGVLVDPSSPAMVAARKDATYTPIAANTHTRWFTEAVPVGRARAAAAAWADYGRQKNRTPMIAVYGLPNRDCGSHSSGGFDPRSYRLWVEQIALGLKGKGAVVVLEPDALGLLGSCAGQELWTSLIRYATYTFARNGTWVYVDSGHSSWHSANVMADRLSQSGVQWARGVATNVSNYRTTNDELAYGRSLVAALATRGYAGKRQLVDTSRNGAGPARDGSWCNTAAARLGSKPKVVNANGVDFYAWVKRPGESDGACNGGPAAGQWWATGARRLLGR
ncbi:glycoside hydrolase family 6 protein [Nocardioides sp. ChNu-153]|uniref:glycoside hydrolase family 6 protein n=1 Tax=unclassified Nocardioides TaxID=2615069 RepID=UPI0024052E3E|nr:MULTISPECIES: glycoside hydrolase family 6 protein [unclassified Nocardioides]MDF9716191.1 glycoside hydrolase family 6 protein [Nocardioides sp. ChNu-99]MDN7121581.1 glycoside hydrolase family 6 protein [Nocardioides sp. ChNu-153]